MKGVPCPVHLLLHVKGMQAASVCIPCEELCGPVFGDYVVPGETVLSGTTVASVDVAAMTSRVPLTVRVISKEEEKKGIRFDGSVATATPAMLELDRLPRVRGTFYEVAFLASGAKATSSYLVRAWGNSSGVTAKLRGLLRAEAKAAKASGKEPAVEDVRSVSSRSLRCSAATAFMNLPADVRMQQLDHSDTVSNGYVQRHAFGKGAINLSDTAIRGAAPSEGELALLLREGNERQSALAAENQRLRFAIGLQDASGASLDERLRSVLSAQLSPRGGGVGESEVRAAAELATAAPAATSTEAVGQVTQTMAVIAVAPEPVVAGTVAAASSARGKRALDVGLGVPHALPGFPLATMAVQGPPAKKPRPADMKKCSEGCVIPMRHDWMRDRETVLRCMAGCRDERSGKVNVDRLQKVLCEADIHTRKKQVKSLLGRFTDQE